MSIQQEILDLQKRLDELNKLVAESEAVSKLPDEFERAAALDFLRAPTGDNLGQAFVWDSTPQGHEFWDSISDALINGDIKYASDLTGAVVIAVQSWVIQSYKEQYGV